MRRVPLVRLGLAGAFALALAAFGPAPTAASDVVDAARELLAAGKYQEVVDSLEQYLRFKLPDTNIDSLLGQALLKLGRNDEAAQHLDRALAKMPEEDKETRLLRKQLTEADPLSARRDGLLHKISKDLFQCATMLDDAGHHERALEILDRIRPIASGGEFAVISSMAAKIRSSTEKVDLDKKGGTLRPPDGWPLVELETNHYFIKANLEPDVAKLLGQTMDEIFGYYVRIYFDGDEKKVDSRKPTIKVHANHEKLMELWGKREGSIPGGWWSPGDWEVNVYDTRTDAGTLDVMLSILFHEASHHFMTMIAMGSGTPSWLNEGTASFFEGASAMADGRVLWPDAPIDRLQTLNMMLGGMTFGGKAPKLVDVIGWNQPRSYDAEYYPWGWGLVYFMQQYEDPTTLEYVYRPLYAKYREEIIKKQGDPKALFEQVFVGPSTPGKQPTLAAWESDWKKWIETVIYPLHFGNDRRARRMAEIERYMNAAKAAALDKKAKVGEQELLLRALGHIEYVRTKIDKLDEPDPTLLLKQADLLEKLGRSSSTAPLLEQLLDMASDGRWEIDAATFTALEKRLSKLDSKNAPLRTARNRAKNLAGTARKLLAEYEDPKVTKTPMPLRAYTFAALAASALDDTAELGKSAARLRVVARDAGLLRGATFKLVAGDGAWTTIFSNKETAFEHSEDRIVLESLRSVGKLCSSVDVSGEYELRARLTRVGEAKIGTQQGVVISGTDKGDWLCVTIDNKGRLLLKLNALSGGGTSDVPVTAINLKQPPPVDKPFDLVVRVLPLGQIEVSVNGEGPYPLLLPVALPTVGHVGVFVKNGRLVLENAVVEVFP
jgi:tetratricopeptide (TPR) repeat protein